MPIIEKMRLRRFLIFLVIVLSGFSVWAQTPNTPQDETTYFPLSFKFPRADGMGGFHATLADDFMTLFVNPAGLSSIEEELSIATFSISTTDFDTMFNLLRSSTLDAAALAGIIKNRFDAGLFIGGPFATGYIKEGFGFAVMNQTYVKTWWERNSIFEVDANVVEEFAILIGASFPISNFAEDVVVTPGFSVKPIVRGVFAPRNVQLDAFRYIFQNLKQEPFELQFGVGIDIGLLVSIDEVFYFGAVVHDAITPLYVLHYNNYPEFTNGNDPSEQGIRFIDQTYDLSFAFRLRDTFVNEVVSDIVFTIDYHGLSNIINEGATREPWMDIGAGIEIHLLNSLWLRVGWQHMMPGGGIGVNLGWAYLDAAFFGESFGNTVSSSFKTYSLSFGFSFRY